MALKKSLRRLQRFQSPCQGMGGTEQGAGCLPANASIPDGASQDRGAHQPCGVGASPTQQPTKSPPVPLPHVLCPTIWQATAQGWIQQPVPRVSRAAGQVTEEQHQPGQGAALCSGYTRSRVNHTGFQADNTPCKAPLISASLLP